ncbi:BQ5605_C013g07231 [Microbotryum silenes-dioicae]|uniref:BQ5605_C013g07231 protein n=1 Tax=Microbotryum silenes-dioicae TaxID=796604 RepID=A0A2X0LVF3_9BASI|nr:BQ5605_C013g07231 [Microbotryum silenes-dioicae]
MSSLVVGVPRRGCHWLSEPCVRFVHNFSRTSVRIDWPLPESSLGTWW